MRYISFLPPPPTTLQLHKISPSKTPYKALLILKQQLMENFSLDFFHRNNFSQIANNEVVI